MSDPFTDENFLLLLRAVCHNIESLDQFCFENGVVPSDPSVVTRRNELNELEMLQKCKTMVELRESVKRGIVKSHTDAYQKRYNELEILQVNLFIFSCK